MRTLPALLLLALAAHAADNQLTPAEKQAGWVLLFDGKTMNGWRDPARKDQPGNAWKVENGALATVRNPRIEEDLITEKSFGDFELKFDWRVSQGGNTGLKYRSQREIFMDNT